MQISKLSKHYPNTRNNTSQTVVWIINRDPSTNNHEHSHYTQSTLPAAPPRFSLHHFSYCCTSKTHRDISHLCTYSLPPKPHHIRYMKFNIEVLAFSRSPYWSVQLNNTQASFRALDRWHFEHSAKGEVWGIQTGKVWGIQKKDEIWGHSHRWILEHSDWWGLRSSGHSDW